MSEDQKKRDAVEKLAERIAESSKGKVTSEQAREHAAQVARDHDRKRGR